MDEESFSSRGTITAIHTAPTHGARPVPQPDVQAVAGKGLEGDRHFGEDGASDVTLIEAEAIAAAAADYDIELHAGAHRRNLTTVDVPLNHLVGSRFFVGEIEFEGVNLCEPCSHMASIVGEREAVSALVHRGGLEARILTTGHVRRGDPVRWRGAEE